MMVGVCEVVNGEVVVGWSQAEKFQGGWMLRTRPTLGQPKVHVHEVPRAVEIYVDEAILDLVALENFPGRFGSIFAPVV